MTKTLLVGLVVSVVLIPGGAAWSEDSWGCEVALCLANPDGPTAAPACHAPMERLAKHLRRGRLFPRCNQTNSVPAAGVANSGGQQPAVATQ